MFLRSICSTFINMTPHLKWQLMDIDRKLGHLQPYLCQTGQLFQAKTWSFFLNPVKWCLCLTLTRSEAQRYDKITIKMEPKETSSCSVNASTSAILQKCTLPRFILPIGWRKKIEEETKGKDDRKLKRSDGKGFRGERKEDKGCKRRKEMR